MLGRYIPWLLLAWVLLLLWLAPDAASAKLVRNYVADQSKATALPWSLDTSERIEREAETQGLTARQLSTPLPATYDLNKVSQRVGKKHVLPIFRRLLRGARKDDGKGFIYIYHKQGQTLPRDVKGSWKVGCTGAGVGVERRLKQWAKQCGHRPVLDAKYRTKHHAFCEILIHMELKARRQWLGNVACLCNATRGHQEWFSGTLSEVEETVKFWTDYVDHAC